VGRSPVGLRSGAVRLTFGQSRASYNPMKDGKIIHELHREAAEKHELAAHAHRTAAEHNEKGDQAAGDWHSQRAMEYSDHAYKLAKEAHTKSGQIGTL